MKSILIILAWKDLRKHFCITVDIDTANSINIHISEGKRMKFKEILSGLHIWNPLAVKIGRVRSTSKYISVNSFIYLIVGNKQHFKERHISG